MRWYVLYSVIVVFLIVALIGPFGFFVAVGCVGIWCNFIDKDKNADRIKAFLKRHRMPPFHKDDLVK